MDADEMARRAALQLQPPDAHLKGIRNNRPSPKGEQRLWLYQCAVKSCSKGELKLTGTSRPKGRDVPSCFYCSGKMHWKGTERDPAAQPGGGPGHDPMEGVTATSAHTATGNNLNVPGSSHHIRKSTSPPASSQSQFPITSSYIPIMSQNTVIQSASSRSGDGSRLTPGSTGAAETSPASSSGENRGGRPWEL